MCERTTVLLGSRVMEIQSWDIFLYFSPDICLSVYRRVDAVPTLSLPTGADGLRQ